MAFKTNIWCELNKNKTLSVQVNHDYKGRKDDFLYLILFCECTFNFHRIRHCIDNTENVILIPVLFTSLWYENVLKKDLFFFKGPFWVHFLIHILNAIKTDRITFVKKKEINSSMIISCTECKTEESAVCHGRHDREEYYICWRLDIIQDWWFDRPMFDYCWYCS